MPTPSTDRRHARRLTTRLTILSAAEHIVITEGYTNLTTKKLVETAGVSERTIFNHFPSLSDIVLARFGDLLTALFEDHSIPAGLTLQELPTAIDTFFREHIGSPQADKTLERFVTLGNALGDINKNHDALADAVINALCTLAKDLNQHIEADYPHLTLDQRFTLTHYIFQLSTSIALGIGKAINLTLERNNITPGQPIDLSALNLSQELAEIRAGIFWAFDTVNQGQPRF